MNLYPSRIKFMGRAVLVCRGGEKCRTLAITRGMKREKKACHSCIYWLAVSLRSRFVFVEDEEVESSEGKVRVHPEKHESARETSVSSVCSCSCSSERRLMGHRMSVVLSLRYLQFIFVLSHLHIFTTFSFNS